jgi:hypothetical protein
MTQRQEGKWTSHAADLVQVRKDRVIISMENLVHPLSAFPMMFSWRTLLLTHTVVDIVSLKADHFAHVTGSSTSAIMLSWSTRLLDDFLTTGT